MTRSRKPIINREILKCRDNALKTKLLWIGRSKDRRFIDLIAEYRKRLAHYCAIEIEELREVKSGRRSADELKKLEGDELLRHLDDRDFVVLLDERGSQHTSMGLSRFLQTRMNAATPRSVFVIGGAFGVSEAVTHRADFIWSLSELTLTHDMSRIVLIEQIYRAHTILRGEKYHNE